MEAVNGKQLLMDAPVFFLPLGVLVFLLVKGFTLPYVGFWSILTVVALGIISGALRKEVRLDFRQTIRRIVESVRSANPGFGLVYRGKELKTCWAFLYNTHPSI